MLQKRKNHSIGFTSRYQRLNGFGCAHSHERTSLGLVSLFIREKGVVSDEVKTANRYEHKRNLDVQILGILVFRAATERIGGNLQEFKEFTRQYGRFIRELSREHHMPIEERITKANQRYRFT